MHTGTNLGFATCFALLLLGAGTAVAQGGDPRFRPALLGVEAVTHEVRPGGAIPLGFRFENRGEAPARGDYMVFVHLEDARRTCATMSANWDHYPTLPTSAWMPGETMVDGPLTLGVPTETPEGVYSLHIGVYIPGASGERVLETYVADAVTVSRSAPDPATLGPKPLSATEVETRAAALAARIPDERALDLRGEGYRFRVSRDSGAWSLLDEATATTWSSDPLEPVFATVTLAAESRKSLWRVTRFDEQREGPEGLSLVTRPTVEGQPTGVEVTFTVARHPAPAGVRIAYSSTADADWHVERVQLLDHALGVTDSEDGRLYIPQRLGIERVAATGLPGRESWRTYDDLTMQMCGAVKGGSALLVNWESVEVLLSCHTSWPESPFVPGARMRSVGLELMGASGAATLHPLGRGGYVEIAHAYRPLARAKGWLKPWSEKRAERPSIDRIFGATDFKPFVYTGVVPGSRFATDDQERHSVSFTFDEAARAAEHWRSDLGIDRAFVVLAGWINGGYDIRHPDPLPAAEACGGDAGLIAAAERIRGCGYLFGLHDNYQDMYRDAPSWGEEWLNKDADGTPRMGGNWAGGQAWQVCAECQVALASRPETNLPRIAELFGPSIYFIDTVFAWPLVTCEDPAHPMTRADDLRWKSELSLLAQEWFGLFGSEEGREWAVPCSDYLEGLFGAQTESPVGAVIPLFPLVYSDCVQIMTHQGQRMGPGDAKRILDHVLFAEMPLAQFGDHLYWERADATPSTAPVVPLAPSVRATGNRRFEITYRWQVEGKPTADCVSFVHYTSPTAERAEGIAYQNDHAFSTPITSWEPGTIVEDGPHTVEVPEGAEGEAEVCVGLLAGNTRMQLGDIAMDGGRVSVGRITVRGDQVSFTPATLEHRPELWARGDGGWGAELCPTDRVIKNSWEVLSPLNVLTAERALDSHEFLTEDRTLQRTRFGDCTVTVSFGKPAEVDDVSLPPYGFVIESPTFVAFLALRYGGIEYATPTLFTAQSLDSKPLAESSQVRLYHGFGDPRIRLAGREFRVVREETVAVR